MLHDIKTLKTCEQTHSAHKLSSLRAMSKVNIQDGVIPIL